MTTADVYEVLVVKYGTRQARRSEVFLNYPIYGEPDAPIGMDYFFWVVRNRQRTVVIDTGFSAHGGAVRGRTTLIEPSTAFAMVGVDPSDAPPVIITHAHYDHIGNLDLFPASEVIIAREEYEFWAGSQARHPQFHHSVEDTELEVLFAAGRDGRVRMFDGRTAFAPGIDVIAVGGHTPGQSMVTVNTTEGVILLASDAIHYVEEFERGMPFAFLASTVDTYAAFDLVRQMLAAGDVAHLITGHDPQTLRRLEEAGAVPLPDRPELAGLAVRIGHVD